MKKIAHNTNSWLIRHIKSINDYLKFVKKKFSYIIIFYLFSLLICTFAHFSPSINIINTLNIWKSVNGALTYVYLISICNIAKWFVDVISFTILLVWFFISYFIFIISRLIVDFFFQLIVKEKYNFTRNRTRFYLFLKNKVGKKLNILLIIYLFFCSIYLLKIQYYKYDTIFIMKHCFYLIIICVPIIYITVWIIFISIRNRRKKKSKKKFDIFLFSQESIRRNFKTIIDAIVFFLILGWILIPGLFFCFDFTAVYFEKLILNKHSYKENYELIESEGYNNNLLKKATLKLPNVTNLKDELHAIRSIINYEKIKKNLKKMQRGLFFILTLVSFCEIGIPSIVNAVIFKNKRKALKNIFISTIKTTILIICLQLIISKGFFIDISNIIGLSSLFFIIISFFLMQDTIQLK